MAPKFEKLASWSLELVAATQILFAASGSVAGTHGWNGVVSLLLPWLPAATTYRVPGLLLIAASWAGSVPAPPRLRLATLALMAPA